MPRGIVSRDCDESLEKRRHVKVSSAELKSIQTAATAVSKTVIDAPGPGKFIQILDAVLYNPANSDPTYTAAYTEASADNMELQYADGTVIAILETTAGAVVASTTPTYQRFVFAATTTTVYKLVTNSAVVLTTNDNAFATGTHPMDLYLTYRVVDVSGAVNGYEEV